MKPLDSYRIFINGVLKYNFLGRNSVKHFLATDESIKEGAFYAVEQAFAHNNCIYWTDMTHRIK